MLYYSSLSTFFIFSLTTQLYLSCILKLSSFSYSLFKRTPILICLKDTLSKEEIIELEDKIASIPSIDKLVYVSPKEAYEKLRGMIEPSDERDLPFMLPPFSSFPPLLELNLTPNSFYLFPSFSIFEDVVVKIGILGEDKIKYIQYPKIALKRLEKTTSFIRYLIILFALLIFIGYLISINLLASHLSLILIKIGERKKFFTAGALLEAFIIVSLSTFLLNNIFFGKKAIVYFTPLSWGWIILLFFIILLGEVSIRILATSRKEYLRLI
jgi:hypothetical protein